MLTIKILSYQNDVELHQLVLSQTEIGQSSNFHVYTKGTATFDEYEKESKNLKAVVCYVNIDGDFKEHKILKHQDAYITDNGGNTVHSI